MTTASNPNHPSVVAPTAPRLRLPAGACDCHAHLFGPYDRFPLAPNASHVPPESPLELYLNMLDRVGFARGTPVHASSLLDFDASATLDALDRGGGRLRGITVFDSKITDAQLQELHQRGMRGVRFKEDIPTHPGVRAMGHVGLDEFPKLAPRFKEIGWQAQIWSNCDIIAAAAPMLTGAGIPIVLDHLGGINVDKGTADPAFQTLLSLLAEGSIWVKLSCNRMTRRHADYEDVRPFHDAYVRANPDRLIWGSDWPYMRMGDNTPDIGRLIDRFDAWTGNDDTLRRKVFADNPAQLFGFE